MTFCDGNVRRVLAGRIVDDDGSVPTANNDVVVSAPSPVSTLEKWNSDGSAASDWTHCKWEKVLARKPAAISTEGEKVLAVGFVKVTFHNTTGCSYAIRVVDVMETPDVPIGPLLRTSWSA